MFFIVYIAVIVISTIKIPLFVSFFHHCRVEGGYLGRAFYEGAVGKKNRQEGGGKYTVCLSSIRCMRLRCVCVACCVRCVRVVNLRARSTFRISLLFA